MNDSETFNATCSQCNAVVIALIRAKHVTTRKEAGAIFPDEAPIHGTDWLIGDCPKCGRIFFVAQDWTEVEDSYFAQDVRQLYPVERDTALAGIPPKVLKRFTEAASAYAVRLYESSSIMCGKTLDIMCDDCGAKKGSLSERLEFLKTIGVIDGRLLQWAHMVRLIRNDAAHEAAEEIITKDDALDLLDFVQAILTYVYSLSSRFEELKKRRG